ncbi:RNA-binding domain-containing protein, partial [Hypoxylon cercidicola]
MHSIRRAAARAACSSVAIAVPRQQVASFAMQISKATMRPATMVPLARFFSQTMRVAEDEKVMEEAIESVEETSAPPTIPPSRQIFVSNMSFDVTETHLRDAFTKYGEIVSHRIGRDGRGLSRGFGFVTFETVEDAQRAVDESNQSFWHGRRINVAFKKPEGDRVKKSGNQLEGPTSSLYIGNIPYETSDADLNKIFRELDNVVDVRVAVDRNTGWPRGFAHADFVDVESAQKAFEQLNSIQLGGRSLRIDYAERRPATNKMKPQD